MYPRDLKLSYQGTTISSLLPDRQPRQGAATRRKTPPMIQDHGPAPITPFRTTATRSQRRIERSKEGAGMGGAGMGRTLAHPTGATISRRRIANRPAGSQPHMANGQTKSSESGRTR